MDCDIDIVIGPAEGARVVAAYVADHLSRLDQREVLGLCAEKKKQPGAFYIRPEDISLLNGKRTIVVEDTLSTGASVRAVVELVRKYGAHVVGVGSIINRGGVTEEDVGDVPSLVSLLRVFTNIWESSQCPLCIKGIIPINTNLGKGTEFLAGRY